MPRTTTRSTRRVRGSEVLIIETNHSSAVLEVPIVDHEQPHTEKFESGLLSQIPVLFSRFIGLRHEDKRWRSLKAMPAIPTYMDMSDETRSRLLHDIMSFGNAPSSVIARALGLTSKQVGAIRRWNLSSWRLLTNRHVNSACNFNRVVVKR